MKKYLFLFIGLLSVMAFNDAEAKAVKLGRSAGAFSYKENTVRGTTSIQTTKECDVNCKTCNKQTGQCSACFAGYVPNGSGCKKCSAGTYAGAGAATCTKCSAGYYSKEGAGNCTKCPDGKFSAEGSSSCSSCSSTLSACNSCNATGTTCTKCSSGYRLLQGACVENCSGISCASGATPTSSNNGCCCKRQADPNCQTSNSGNVCTKCKTGYQLYLGRCRQAQEISCPNNCAQCSDTLTCTKCNSGYRLKNGSCVSCPSHATCNGTSTVSCNSGYVWNSVQEWCKLNKGGDPCANSTDGTPAWCSDGKVRVPGKGCCPSASSPSYQCLQCRVF